MERQNYSNYRVVMVDDNSPDQSAQHYYKYLQGTTYRLRNRITIVKTSRNLGALGNMYIWVRKYCSSDSIVVNVDSDDAVIGAQTFNILNAIYQDPETWYVYTRFMLHQRDGQELVIYHTISRTIDYNISRYRHVLGWVSSHLRTYRQQLMANVPV